MSLFAKSVLLFPNGNSAVFDAEGQQIPMLQESWFLLFVAFLEREGVDPLALRITLPSGHDARIFKRTGGGYNWEVSP